MPTPRSVEVGLSPLTAINAASRGISRPRSAKAPLISERDKPRRNMRPRIYYRPGGWQGSIGRWSTRLVGQCSTGEPRTAVRQGMSLDAGAPRRRGAVLVGAPDQEREQPHDEGRAGANGGENQHPAPRPAVGATGHRRYP